jgi:type IV pilus assembly protein PilW
MCAFPSSPRRCPGRRQRGISLVEIMIGLVLGMLSVLVVLQVFQRSDASRRAALGGDDAQNSGALALTQLQRELRQGGHGVASFPIMGCDLLLPDGRTLTAMAPVTVNHEDIPAGDDDTDTVMVVSGATRGSPEGARILVQQGPATYAVPAPSAFEPGDFVIASPATRPAACTLRLTTVTAVAAPNVTIAVAAANMANGRLYNLGTTPRVQVYAVRAQQLTVCDMLANDCTLAANTDDPTVWVPVGHEIVSLRAQYGRDTTAPAMDAVVDVFDQTTPTTACGWMRVSALRLAVVARSPQQDRENVTADPPLWAGSADAPIALDGLADWQQFRYRSFETLVPIRNMTWLQGAPGC